MKSEQASPVTKISYEKPTAVDLGPAAPVVGASCSPGGLLDQGKCADFGNSAAAVCDTGSAAGGLCDNGTGPFTS